MGSDVEPKIVWSPIKIIQWAVPFLKKNGIPNPRFDVEILIAHALKIDRLKVYLQFDRPLAAAELSLIRDFLKRRVRHEPIQYIIGQQEFFGHAFKVGPGVLIPRPETEQLVECVIDFFKTFREEERLLLDLGTGSGCIAISVAKSISCRVWASDLSEKALETAQQNAEALSVDSPINWRNGDWFSALLPGDPKEFKAIVSNPPYISITEMEELPKEIREFEPAEALFAGESGLEAYRELARGMAKNRLLPQGAIFLELHANRCDKINEIFKSFGWKETLLQDFQGLPRVIKFESQ